MRCNVYGIIYFHHQTVMYGDVNVTHDGHDWFQIWTHCKTKTTQTGCAHFFSRACFFFSEFYANQSSSIFKFTLDEKEDLRDCLAGSHTHSLPYPSLVSFHHVTVKIEDEDLADDPEEIEAYLRRNIASATALSSRQKTIEQ